MEHWIASTTTDTEEYRHDRILYEVIPDVLVILIDVLHTVGPALDVDALLLTVAAELPAEEDDEGGEEPDVPKESHTKLDRKGNIAVSVQAEVRGHDEERGDDWEHPNSGPELSLFSSEPLAQAEPNQGDHSHSAVSQS